MAVQSSYSDVRTKAISGTKLVAATVDAAQLATGAVTTAKLADSAITAAKVADKAITAPAVAPATLGPAHVVSAKSTGGMFTNSQFSIGTRWLNR